MKLDVIFERARLDSPSTCATRKDGKYSEDALVVTISLNCSFSAFSDGENYR
jgi:hypothetical protein